MSAALVLAGRYANRDSVTEFAISASSTSLPTTHHHQCTCLPRHLNGSVFRKVFVFVVEREP